MSSEAIMLDRIPRARLTWLERETDRWRADGLIDGDTRSRIVERYEAVSLERRGLLAVVVLAVLMCGIGVLLLIGYNWDDIPAAVRIGMILGAIVAAFAASAAAYAKGRPVTGEALAFLGTLLFGNGIWLIAQVLHIQGHFPDGFLWFAAGALACAWLVESQWIGVAAVALLGVWMIAESTFMGRPLLPFVPLSPLAVLLAYRLRSRVMVLGAGLTAALWVAVATSEAADGAIMAGAMLLAGCALAAADRWHPPGDALGRAWRASGLVVLLVTVVPLMVSSVHRHIESGPANPTMLVIAAVVAAVGLASTLWRPATVAELAVAAAAVTSTVWAAAVWSGALPTGVATMRVGTVVFSALAVAVGLALIQSALASHRTADLVFGVLFAAAFLLVRWVSVIENMLWSGAFLLITGGGLLLVARLWRDSKRAALAAGRVS
jgi:uncharacterized membrane protein